MDDKYPLALKTAFASEYAFVIKAQNFHWNVEGMFFEQFHALFGGIYEETYSSIDSFAENLRIFGGGNFNVDIFSTTGTANLLVQGGLFFNSGYGSAAVAYGCRAWVNFNGTGTVAIRASGNVTSITDNGTGQYTVNFTTAMPDANYAAVTTAGGTINVFQSATIEQSIARTTSLVAIVVLNSSGSVADAAQVSVAIFR
jgi:hypothetical protein